MAPDGSYLIFASNRPAAPGGGVLDGFYNGARQPGAGGNLWRVDHLGHGWSEPHRLPDVINSNTSIFTPSIVADGSLYFMQPSGPQTRFHIFRAQFTNGLLATPIAVPIAAADSIGDFDPAVAPDESFIVFSSARRAGAGSSLFIARRRGTAWGTPVYLGDTASQPRTNNIESRLGPDGHTLYFSSNRVVPTPTRDRAASEQGVELMNAWNDGLANIWVVRLDRWLRGPPPQSERAPISSLEPASIAFTTTSDGFVLMPAVLGDTVAAKLILDTGAGLDVLAPSVVRSVHGRPAGHFTGFRMRGDRIDIPLFIVPKLVVGPLARRDVIVGAWDVLDSAHVDGVIAANDFRKQPITIDFAANRVFFETPESLATRRSAGATWPIQLDDVRDMSLDVFAAFTIGGQGGQCLIDTGSPTATVNARYMTPLGIDKDAADVHRHEGAVIAGAPEVSYSATVPRVGLSGHSDLDVVRPRVSFSHIIYDCVVGVDFWRDKVVSFDIPDRQLIVSRPAARN